MAQPIKIAILAMGGEGGGVLADWLVSLAEHKLWWAQTTSVPGVAQRTGATIYYVELCSPLEGPPPVLALMPTPGDVDIVIASELMEAARAVQRELVTPERTLLVASTHRVYAIDERIALGDGRADAALLLATAREAARRFVGFDMARVAQEQQCPIGAVLLGVLAATAALPWSRGDFEDTIRRRGVGVEGSLRAFAAGFEHAPQPAVASAPAAPAPRSRAQHPAVQALIDRVQGPAALQALLLEGVRRLIDYQDPGYAGLYLNRIDRLRRLSSDEALLEAAARHLALWMSYEDTVRVADLKTRGTRMERVHAEVGQGAQQLLTVLEYLHPRLQEVCDTLPAGLGRWLLASAWPRRMVERWTSKGRVVRTSSLRGFLLLRAVAALRPWRPRSLRFAVEDARIRQWLADAEALAAAHPALATEVLRCQQLVKGYGDTHERGWRNFSTLQQLWREHGAALSPLALASMRQKALADEHGQALAAEILLTLEPRR